MAVGAAVKCIQKDCQRPATSLPVMLLYAPAHLDPLGKHPARSVCGLPTCEGCKHLVDLTYLNVQGNIDMIGAMFRSVGKAAPDPKRTKLTWIAIDSDEAKSFLDLKRTRHQ